MTVPHVFDPVHLEWDGKRYTIAPDRVMGAIARVEQHVTLGELLNCAKERGSVPLATIANAYASVLQYAGGQVDAAVIYRAMMRDKNRADLMSAAIGGLAAMMLPPNRDGASSPGKPNRRARRAAASSSRKHTS
jgi:hypothetical protein